MIVIDLSRFAELKLRMCKNKLDMRLLWCYFINYSAVLTEKDFEVFLMSQEPETFKIARDNLKSLSMDTNTRLAEIQRKRAIRDSFALVNDAKYQAMKKGREEGRQEGLQTGREEGREEGLEKGRQAIALNMLQKKLDISLIAEVTGLTEKEIKNLRKR